MQAQELNITIIQPDILWEDKEANLKQYEQHIDNIKEKKEVIVLPEMFSTGFSMASKKLAEPMDGVSVQWMKDTAKKNKCILTGSLIIEENGDYFNRLLWVQPDGQIGHYDKRHLFAYADENNHYKPGSKRLITSVKGLRICLMVCYDLRFPVWSRNQAKEYDILIYVANWPERRDMAWTSLLRARAIENQSYVIGVNRVGLDGNNINYIGNSSVFDPLGEQVWQESGKAVSHTVTISREKIDEVRERFPFLHDADKFVLL